jgi:Xaa-Pro aminopeptidase
MEASLFNQTIEELQLRWKKLRELLKEHVPGAGGVFVFSRLNIYYLTGTFGNGLLWLPLEGGPVLMLRRGMERARAESPLDDIRPFKSYRDVTEILSSTGSVLPDAFLAEMNGLSWALANSFMKYMNGYHVLNGDAVIGMARAHKTPLELKLMREAGRRHDLCLVDLLPLRINPGMTEMEIVRIISDMFFEHGHCGILRMEKYGEEVYMGHISSGDSGNYSSVFNGALGLRGLHPSVPHMGSSKKIWSKGEVMMIDNGFSFEGYQTDKSHVYWSGRQEEIPGDARSAHDLCIEMQEWIAGQLRPGVIPSDIWAHCSQWAERAGFGEGFMGLPENKVGFVGHGIGLAVDEYPVLARGIDQPLEEGMVLAVEPKIGMPGLGMVGIENTFEVTPEGGVSLTGDRYDISCV